MELSCTQIEARLAYAGSGTIHFPPRLPTSPESGLPGSPEAFGYRLTNHAVNPFT